MYTLNCAGQVLSLGKPVVMGIINITPDSFFAGSRKMDGTDALRQAEKMIREGAAILDLGGQSTRPGSEQLTADEEAQRVIPALEAIRKEFPSIIISIDTFYSTVAKAAANAGAGIINDISAGQIDPELLPTVARLRLPYVAMHMQGRPKEMQLNPHYENVTREVLDFFIQFAGKLRSLGIDEWIVDPGFGFGKTTGHNFELIRNLELFQILNRPVLMGISRKSTIYKTLGIQPKDALNGTTVLNTIGLSKGANILRVHDVKEAREAIELMSHL